MSTEPADPGHDDDPAALPEVSPDTGDDVLEGEVIAFPGGPPAPAAQRRGGQPGELRQIIPAHLRTRAGIRKALAWRYRRARHHALYHLVRSPQRLVLTVVWAVVGVARVAQVQASWWWLSEQSYLRQEAVAANDARTWYQLHQHAREVRLLRGCVLAAELAAIGLAAAVITVHVPVAWLPIAGGGGAGAGVDRPPGRQAHPRLGRGAGGLRAAHPRGDRPGAGRAGHRRDEQGAARVPRHRRRAGGPDHPRRPRLAGRPRPAATA